MRLPLLAAVAAGLSLTQCQFSGLGLGEDGGVDSTAAQSTSEASTTAPSTGESDPTTTATTDGDACGNAQIDEGESCDNGMLNNGMNGSICKDDCQLNVCGDGYAASNEGCDDGNTADGDGCGADCKLEGCGDGVLKPPEECDDGNVLDGDGCSSLCRNPYCGDKTKDPGEECDAGADKNLDKNLCTSMCKINVCGDGLVLEGMEACDDGNADEDACTDMCLLPTCGDGKVQAGEECDDGPGDADDACTAFCKEPECGDGLVQPSMGEECDAAGDNGNDKACTEACKNAECGDGLLQDGVEICDDGNKVETDNCLSTCKVAICGDGMTEGKETCDDGNTDPGDSCSATCQKECGNNLVDPGEECDDGNMNMADTCDNSCKRLRYFVFVTSAKYKADFDGVIEADKACNALAMMAKLSGAGNYKAWLSTKVDGENPDKRLFHSSKPYILTNNVKVADNWTDLVDGTPLAQQINLTEAKAAPVPGNPNPANCAANDAPEMLVWTNTTPTATPVGADCSNWTYDMDDQEGGVGMLNHKTMWTDACPRTCDKQARFYCFEQPVP